MARACGQILALKSYPSYATALPAVLLAYSGGGVLAPSKSVPVRVTTVDLPVIDVRATRKGLGLTQSEFAARFGFHPATLRNWEQGRTRPDGPARVLLAVIARHPEAVEDALRIAS
jgi:putative transcriptional regulator